MSRQPKNNASTSTSTNMLNCCVLGGFNGPRCSWTDEFSVYSIQNAAAMLLRWEPGPEPAPPPGWEMAGHPVFLAVQVRDTTELSVVMERSWTGDAFPGRRDSSVLSRLSFRCWVDIHWKTSTRYTEIHAATWVSDLGKDRISWMSSCE